MSVDYIRVDEPFGIEPPARPLSQRELEVLHLAASGMSRVDVGRELTIAPSTVGGHLLNIRAGLGVSTTDEAVEVAWRLGLIPVEVKQ